LKDPDTGHVQSSGSIYWGYLSDLGAIIQDAVDEEDIYDDLQTLFPTTKPFLYGLWIESPLSKAQCRTLYKLHFGMARDVGIYRAAFKDFLKALQQAQQQGDLYVRLSPPGHSGFGILTIFAHCPRCKAEAPFPRWYEYPSEPTSCPVCQNVYSPAETHSDQELKYENADRPRLPEEETLWSKFLWWLKLPFEIVWELGGMMLTDLVIDPLSDAVSRTIRRIKRSVRRFRRARRHQ
jgi:hypothetical protein